MESSFLYFFELILRVAFKLVPNAINKRSRIAEFFLKKGLELSPGYGDYFFTLMLVLILSASIADGPWEEQSCKGGMFWARGLGCVEIIFTLLTKVVAIYMKFPSVYV